MGWLDSLKALFNAVDTEYDRRIRAASNVRQYNAGGHAAHAGDGHATDHQVEHLEGEGGVTGPLQAHAGPQIGPEGQGGYGHRGES